MLKKRNRRDGSVRAWPLKSVLRRTTSGETAHGEECWMLSKLLLMRFSGRRIPDPLGPRGLYALVSIIQRNWSCWQCRKAAERRDGEHTRRRSLKFRGCLRLSLNDKQGKKFALTSPCSYVGVGGGKTRAEYPSARTNSKRTRLSYLRIPVFSPNPDGQCGGNAEREPNVRA